MPAIPTSTIARSAVPVYPYVNPEQPDFVALGLQSIIQINGLNLNDRLRPDRYKIDKISGLGQADIRDNRLGRPAAHGEIVYDSFYGGSTMTFEGRIEAGTLAEVSRMHRDLRAALGPLVETPVKFNWWDIHDDFSDGVTSNAFWTEFSPAVTVFPSDGTMRFSTGGVSYYALRKYVDARISGEFVIGAPVGTAAWGVACSIIDSENYIKLVVSASAGNVFTIKLFYVLADVETELTSSTTITTPIGGQSVWLSLQSVGDTLIGNAYEVDPQINPFSTAIASTSTTLSGSIANKFGYGVGGMAGMVASGNLTSWVAQDFRVDSIWPGDFYISARPIAPLQPAQTREGSTTSRFQIPFQFALRASNPRILSPVFLSVSAGPIVQPNLGRIYKRIFKQVYTVPLTELGVVTNPTAVQQMICSNKGTWLAQPEIKIHGGITNPMVVNLTTGEELILNGTIAENDYLIINCANHTIVNSSGANQFGLFSPASSWIQLVPGDNVIVLAGSASSGSPLCEIVWQHTWI